jgi:hypothetical protein
LRNASALWLGRLDGADSVLLIPVCAGAAFAPSPSEADANNAPAPRNKTLRSMLESMNVFMRATSP